jgi:hypothetical protein
MINMSRINSIRRRRREGESIASIARAEGVSEPTVRKYLRVDDLSARPPVRKGVGTVGARRVDAHVIEGVARGGSGDVAQAAAYGDSGSGSGCETSMGRRCRCRR